MEKIKIKEMVSYNGHQVKANGIVNLSFKAMYSELTNSIKLLQLLNNDVKITCKIGKEPVSLGMFRIKSVIISDDGTSTLKFDSATDYVEINNLNTIIVSDEFRVLFEADVDLEEE